MDRPSGYWVDEDQDDGKCVCSGSVESNPILSAGRPQAYIVWVRMRKRTYIISPACSNGHVRREVPPGWVTKRRRAGHLGRQTKTQGAPLSAWCVRLVRPTVRRGQVGSGTRLAMTRDSRMRDACCVVRRRYAAAGAGISALPHTCAAASTAGDALRTPKVGSRGGQTGGGEETRRGGRGLR